MLEQLWHRSYIKPRQILRQLLIEARHCEILVAVDEKYGEYEKMLYFECCVFDESDCVNSLDS